MNQKKSIILTIVAVATLIALVVGATFAYFQAQGGNPASADVRVTTYTTDLLTFTTGNAIAIYADQANFADGLGNQTGETFARAHLLANSKTNTATANYYVYLNVTNNTFEYTQADETAELLLQVTDPAGNTVESLSGLEYKTVTDGKGAEVKGFDVTTFNGLVTIANNYEIVANNETTQTWIVKLVFVNLDADQTANAGNSLSATLKVQKEKEVLTMANICKRNQTLASCVQSMYGVDDTLYYHDSNLANGANDNSYRYAGSSDTTNNFVCFGSDAATCPDDNLYRIIGVFGDQVKLIKWDYATTTLLGTDGDSNGACADDSNCNYGITKNYYKGSNTAANIGAYYWNYANSSATYSATKYYNVWSYSELNTVNLNTNYLNNIGTEWSSKIAETTWKVGGNTYANVANSVAATAYANEITNPDATIESTYKAKVALMYTSDYGFAASPSAWTTTLGNYNSYINDNWMYMGIREWTVVRYSNSTRYALFVNFEGMLNNYHVNLRGTTYGVRPVFYLESSVNYVSGSGTKTNPITIN